MLFRSLAVANGIVDNVAVLLGKGDGTFELGCDCGVGRGPVAVVVGDFNADGVQDLAVAYRGTVWGRGGVAVLLGNGDGTFQAASSFAVGASPRSVALGDFNRDGHLDLVVANAGSNSVSVLLGKGDGTFQAAQDFGVGSEPWSIAVGDFNGDGKPDLAVANSASDSVAVLMNDTP